MSEREHYPWKRFWRPEGLEVSCGLGGEGFFDDPEGGHCYSFNPGCRTLPELVADLPVLVLCGPPGSGKTTELESVCKGLPGSEGFEVVFRRAAAFGGGSLLAEMTTRSTEWCRALENGKDILLLIDGMDEALQREHSLLNSLVELLKGEDLGRVRLVLSCRSAIWQPEAGANLARLWGREATAYVHEICPLRRIDVALAAERESPGRADGFFSEVERAEAIPLARWPITLNMLVDHFKIDERLPESRGDLYRSAIKRMVDDWDEDRERRLCGNAPDWRPGEKVQLARRIAAFAIFGGKSAVARSNRCVDASILSYHEIMGDEGNEEGSSGIVLPITEEKLDHLTATRLFEATGMLEGGGSPRTVKFSHRTFAELLAGEYMARLGSEALRRLFFIRQESGEELIVPQLLQTAAWLAGSSVGSSFFDQVLSLHPEAFLLADLAPLDDDQKAAIVQALIQKAAAGEPGPDRAVSKASRSLKYPGIDRLLGPAILDETASLHVRRFALNLARTCRISELAEKVWTILDRPNDPMALEAAYCLRVVEDAVGEHKQRLMQFASGDSRSDSSDTLKGVALEMLVPRHVAVREILELLTPPQMEFYGGSYRWFLTQTLPKAVTVDDLSPCLDFLRSKPACFDSLSPYEDFANQVFDLALDNLETPEISDRLVLLWLEASRNFLPLPHETPPRGNATGLSSQSQCDALCEALLNHPEVTPDDVGIWAGETLAPSLEFLLRRLPVAPPERRPLWARAIRYAAQSEDRLRLRDLLHRRYEEFDELRDVFPPIRKPGSDLHDTLCRYERAGELILARRRKQNEARLSRIVRQRSTWKEVFFAGLEQCRNGKSGGWINIANAARRDADSESWIAHGIESSDLFSQLADDDHQTIRACARRFLLEFNDEEHDTRRPTNWSEAAYEAVKWLRDEIASEPEMGKAVSERWIGALIDAFNNGEKSHQEIVRFAYRLNPEHARRWLRQILDRSLRDEGEGWLIDLRAFETAWDRDLSRELADFLSDPDVKPRSMREGLRHLLEHDPEFGSGFVADLLEALRQDDVGLRQGVSRAVAGVALFFGGEAEAEAAWPLVAANLESARTLFQEIVHDLDREDFDFLGRMRPARVTDLLLLFFRLFPPEDDPSPSQEMTFVTPLDSCIQLRGGLLHFLTKRGETEEIRRFLKTLPPGEADLYRWNLDEAKQTRALLDWNPSQPEELLRLVRISNGSFIRHADDLLEVVLGSLDRFQVDLQGQHLHRVWDGNTPKREEFVSKELVSWLKGDLKDVAVNREVEVNRWNERVDIKIEAFAKDKENREPITLIIEVKRAHNREIPESIEKQLAGKYLLTNCGWTHGIYLVAWFLSKGTWEERQYLRSKTPRGAKEELRRSCHSVGQSRGLRIEPFLLDCSFGTKKGSRKSGR